MPQENYIDPSQTKPIPSHAKKVFDGHIHKVWQCEQELYDGSTTTFERISRADYAYVIGVTPDKKILLVIDEQPDRGAVISPAGGGVAEGENPKDAAVREFLEETGYAAEEYIHWHTYRPSAKTEMLTYAYIGRGAVKRMEPTLEPGERVAVQLYSFDEFLLLGKDPKLRDWLLKVKLLEAMLDEKEKERLHDILFGN